MGKYINAAHITGDRGVIKFKEYCNKHDPYIVFREIKEHDYGIDGEIELVKFDNQQRMMASGQILKIQLKSTASANSYIKNQTESEFTFYATQDDFEYWAEHNLGVILIVYDCQTERLFARKITQEDYAYHKQFTKTKSYPIRFNHVETELFLGEGTFFEKVKESYFKPRFDGSVTEKLVSNIQYFSTFPKKMYVFDTPYKTKREIFGQLDKDLSVPPFSIYNKKIYCFQNIPSFHKDFREKIVQPDCTPETMNWQHIYDEKPILNHYVEVLNQYLKDFFLKDRHLWVNKKNKSHFFFPKPPGQDSLEIKYKTLKREIDGKKTVVNKYEYGKDVFYRHAGFTYNIDFIDGVPIFILNYKYHFTKDGSVPLAPLKITKYTNRLNSREYNDQVLGTMHFWYECLRDGHFLIEIADSDECRIKIKPYEEITANFGIYRTKDFLHKKVKIKDGEAGTQNTLF